MEPGLDSTKRLAGELIHPPGVNDLAELGLLDTLVPPGAAPVSGFAVVPDAQAAPYLLPYGDIPGVARTGFAMDHARLTSWLLATAVRPGVIPWLGARVTGLDLDHREAEAPCDAISVGSCSSTR